jgi:hypothetical protein
MFIWNKKHYSVKQDVENTTVDELIKESTPINIPAKERLMKSPSNSYSSSYGTSIDTLHTSLIDDYHQTFIRFLCKDTQTDMYSCEECNIKNNKMIDIIGQIDQYIKKLEETKIKLEETEGKLEENIKEYRIERDENMQRYLDLQIINENIKYDNQNLRSENKRLSYDIENIKKKYEGIEMENQDIREENRNIKFELDKLQDKIERLTSYKKDDENKKKAILSEDELDSQDLFTNRSDIFGYINEISHLKKINIELTNKLKRLNIQDECDFNRAIRSRFPVRFHAVHTDSYYLN